MPKVDLLKSNENFNAALRRFKRACEKAGIPSKLREKEFYEKPTTKRKRKKAAAVKRHQKRLFSIKLITCMSSSSKEMRSSTSFCFMADNNKRKAATHC